MRRGEGREQRIGEGGEQGGVGREQDFGEVGCGVQRN